MSLHDSADRFRDEPGWNNSHKVFSLVGRAVSWKGQDSFIRALAELYLSDEIIRGLIVGDGEDPDKGRTCVDGNRSFASSFGLDDVVSFTGRSADIPGIMKSSDVVVYASSLPEPYGRVIIESMAAGSAVIASGGWRGAPDIIENDVSGLLVPLKDSRALASAMLRMSKEDQYLTGLALPPPRFCMIDKHIDKVCYICQ